MVINRLVQSRGPLKNDVNLFYNRLKLDEEKN